jgi:hypothetical protein
MWVLRIKVRQLTIGTNSACVEIRKGAGASAVALYLWASKYCQIRHAGDAPSTGKPASTMLTSWLGGHREMGRLTNVLSKDRHKR